MGKLSAFTFITLDGFFKGPEDDISWHNHGEEETRFSEEMLSLGNMLVFGRRTYEMMADFWTTDMAWEMSPKVAEGMSRAEKIVFSRQNPPDEIWENTRFITADLIKSIDLIKKTERKNMTILGSGSIVSQLSDHNLIDEYQIMIDPIVLGKGSPLFGKLKHPLNLKLTETRTFPDGIVLLRYETQ